MGNIEAKIDGYEIEKAIGEGGMCSVYSAIDKQFGRSVAIKVLLPQLAEQREQRERFLTEGRHMAKLQHPNVVQVYDVGKCNVGPYIIMEYIEGKTLRQLMNEGLPTTETMTIGAHIARVLDYAHSKGYLHRDLKPSNIIIAKDGLTKVADWGLSKSMEDPSGLTKTGIVVGTPGYMSPEQILGKELKGTSDLYALGVILYEALAGVHPFGELPITELLAAQLTKKPKDLAKLNSAIARPISNIIHSLLRKKEVERESNAAWVAKRLEDLSEGAELKETNDNQTIVLTQLDVKTTARQKRNPLLWLLPTLFILFVCFQLLAPNNESKLVRAPIFKATDLKSLYELNIRYDVFAPTRATFTMDGYPDQKLKLLPAKNRRGSLRNLTLKLRPPLTKPTKLTIKANDKNWSFDYSPQELINDVLSPVKIAEKSIASLSKKMDQLRIRLESVRVGKGKSAFTDFRKTYTKLDKELHRLLVDSGLDTKAVSQMNIYLKDALPKNVLPGTKLARRLLPLRQIERALSEHNGLKVPWQPIYGLLGFQYTEGYCKPVKGSWTRIVHLNIIRKKGNRNFWYWLGQRRFVESLQKSSIVAMTTLPTVKRQLVSRQGQWDEKRDYFPTAKEIEWRLSTSFHIGENLANLWPPSEARVFVVIKLFARHNEILFWLNDKGPVSLLNLALMDWAEHTGRSSISALTASFPIEPSWLELGKNQLRIEVTTAPGEEYIAPIALSDIVIDCSFSPGVANDR